MKNSWRYIYTKVKVHLVSRVLQYNPYYGFSFFANDLLGSEQYNKWGFYGKNYYEFGTGEGISLFNYLKGLKSYCSSHKVDISKYNIFLFDSFEGLPEYKGQMNENPAWSKGMFSGSTNHIKKMIRRVCGKNQPTVTFVKGYYEITLTSELIEQLRNSPPSIINIDVDYYESTRIVLNWIYPILQNGTIFHFDDLYEYLGSPYKGEFLAISEFNELHKVEKSLLFPFNSFGISKLNNTIYSFTKNNK